MLKKLYILSILLLFSNVYAGVFEDAMSKQNNVLLYLYSNDCSMCNQFLPIYDSLSQSHKDITFVKVDAETSYGINLMRKFKGLYVPFVVISSPKSKKHAVINPYCVIDTICIERAIKSFK